MKAIFLFVVLVMSNNTWVGTFDSGHQGLIILIPQINIYGSVFQSIVPGKMPHLHVQPSVIFLPRPPTEIAFLQCYEFYCNSYSNFLSKELIKLKYQ